MTVRKMILEDIPVVAQIHVEAWASAYAGLIPEAVIQKLNLDFRIKQWQRTIQNLKLHCYVVEQDGRLEGFCSLAPSEDGLEIKTIYVRPSTWRSGVGSQLMQQVLNNYPKTSLSLWVLVDNQRAIAFYKKWNFVETGELKSDESLTPGHVLQEQKLLRTSA